VRLRGVEWNASRPHRSVVGEIKGTHPQTQAGLISTHTPLFVCHKVYGLQFPGCLAPPPKKKKKKKEDVSLEWAGPYRI
jgi:hypothetical protein